VGADPRPARRRPAARRERRLHEVQREDALVAVLIRQITS
jgi:hypothetical protein